MAEPFQPMISVVIPVYNGARYLGEAITSALDQAYPKKEVIVVNDGSNDDGKTEAVAKSFGNRIRYYAKENGGVSSALNMGIKEAKGEYIAWLSHDDAFNPQKLEAQVRFLGDIAPDYRPKVIPHANFEYMDEQSKVFARYRHPIVMPEKFYQALLCEMVFEGSPCRRRRFGVNGCTTLIPKAAFDKIGMFDEKLRTTQDFDMWFRMNKVFDFVLMDGFLLRSRLHPEQGVKVMKDVAQEEVGQLYDRVLDYYIPGSDKFDLDLAQVILALKMSPRKKVAYKRALEAYRRHGGHKGDAGYLLLARIWNRAFELSLRAIESRRWRSRS